MIKSKIDAREKALELAIRLATQYKIPSGYNIRDVANEFAQYIIGSADLPETAPSAEDSVLKIMEAVNQASQINRPLSMEAMFAEALTRKGTAETASGNFKRE